MTTYQIPFILPDKASADDPSIKKEIVIEADFYPASESFHSSASPSPGDVFVPGRTILYFHGGGLLCGSRKDFPHIYRDSFLKEGYHFLAFDYPLAPELSVPQIVETCLFCVQWFCTHYQDTLGLKSPDYFLFGRSAGAYLVLQTAFQMKKNPAFAGFSVCSDPHQQHNSFPQQSFPLPLGLLLFYGYHSLKEPEFSAPNSYYQTSYPPVSREQAFQAAKRRPFFDTLKSPRVLLYLYARQTGSWTELLGSLEDLDNCSLALEQLSNLPPAFLTASSTDRDVPFGISKRMCRSIPGSLFHPIYNLDHEFDQDLSRPEGKQAYEACLKWMRGR
ncbi:alpha/beta hydrolase [Lachnospiraceae bacterium 62-35]